MDETTKITNKVLKKRKANRIASIVCLAVVGVLILTTILLAVIPISTGVRFVNTPDQIYLKIGSTIYQVERGDERTGEDFDKIWSAYQAACNPTVIATIFGGYAGAGMTANHSNNTNSFANLATDTTFAVTFYWKDNQTMINANGSTFTYMSGSYENTNPTYFREAHFAVTNENVVQDSRVLLRTSTNTTSSSTQFYYTGVANYFGLYNVLNQMVEDGKFTPA